MVRNFFQLLYGDPGWGRVSEKSGDWPGPGTRGPMPIVLTTLQVYDI